MIIAAFVSGLGAGALLALIGVCFFDESIDQLSNKKIEDFFRRCNKYQKGGRNF